MKLRPYQLEGVKEILDKKKVLIADDMGLGKCAEAISAKVIIEKNDDECKTLIVCPASVAKHWQDQIQEWDNKESNIVKIDTSTCNEDIIKAKKADYVIIGYPTLSYLGNSEFIKDIKSLNFKYGIIDEAHNAKNPESYRSISVKHLFDSMEYLSMLSGTPIPNSVIDIYLLLSLLDKEKFPLSTANPKIMLNTFYNLFKKDPEMIRNILNDRMIRRTAGEYLHKSFPELKLSNLEVELTGDHKEGYMQVYENDNISPSTKLINLRQVALDPNLINPKLLNKVFAEKIGKMESSVYNSLDNLLDNIINHKGKALIFSDFKTGVCNKLLERYSKYGTVLINGDNNDLNLREETRKRFQNSSDCRVLLTTTVMDEGVDLTAATDIIHLTLPYTPATFDQRNKRSQRIGEINKNTTNVHVMKPILKRGVPTIAEGIEQLLNDKRKIITYILQQPFMINPRDLKELNGHTEKSKSIKNLISSPYKNINSHLSFIKGQGSKKIAEFYKKYPNEAKLIASLYSSNWEGHYGGNTANLYGKVINILEEKIPLIKKIDIASGPFSLSRKLKQPVINLDINNYMHETGKILEEENLIISGNKPVRGAFYKLPFKENQFDLAVCSLALHMSKTKFNDNGKEINEREQSIKEANRILKTNGYYIITLPHSVISVPDLPKFYEGVEKLGFEVLPFSGFYKGVEDSKFKVYMAGFKKIKDSCQESLDGYFNWKMDNKLNQKKGRSKDKKGGTPNLYLQEKEDVAIFYNTSTKKSLEESVRDCL